MTLWQQVEFADKEPAGKPRLGLPLASRAERDHITALGGRRRRHEVDFSSGPDAGGGVSRLGAGERAGQQQAGYRDAGDRHGRDATRQAVPGGIAVADGGWLAHLLEEPGRCRRASRPDDRGCHAVADRLADTATRRRRASDDLRLYR